MKCAIVIPTHKPTLDKEEIASLRNTLKIFVSRDVFILLPHDVSGEYYKQFEKDHGSICVVNLEQGYLGSVEKYNAMGLSARFYGKFEKFDYMLICHLDSWVFRDDLNFWMSEGYDYIGAPLFLEEPSRYSALFDLAAPIGGNGGLCLRRIKKMLEITAAPRLSFNYLLFCRGVFFLLRNRRYDLLRIYFFICRGIRSNHLKFQRKHNVYEDVND